VAVGEIASGIVVELLRQAYGQAAAVSVPSSGDGNGILGRFPAGLDDVIAYIDALASSTPELVDWFFLVGAPGNGKSRAVHELARKLGIELPPSSPEKPTSRTFPEAWLSGAYPLGDHQIVFINDASIDRPAAMGGGGLGIDIVETLEALENGRRVVLFANVNRGVLVDELARGGAVDEGLHAQAGEIVRFLAGTAQTDGRSVSPFYRTSTYKTGGLAARVHAISLDILSLLEPSPGVAGATLQIAGASPVAAPYRTIGHLHRKGSEPRRCRTPAGELLADLVSEARWSGCAEHCAASDLCPFQANAKWLREQELAAFYLDTLRAAEISSGWRMTYRELLAEFAAALLGPVEPEWSQGGDPCEWVRDRTPGAEGDLSAALSLSTHRIYASVFGPPALAMADLDAFRGSKGPLGVVGGYVAGNTGRAPRVASAVGALRPSRDTSVWQSGAEADLKLSATERVETMAVAESALPSAWASGSPSMLKAAHSAVEEALDTALRARVLAAYADPEAALPSEVRLLLKVRLHLLLNQIGLATGQIHKRDEVSLFLSAQRALLNKERPPEKFADGLKNLILGSGEVNLFSPRASTNEAPPGSSRVSVELATNIATNITIEGDQLVLKIDDAAGGGIPISFDLLREALVAAEPGSGFTDIPEIQLARIERARARLVSRDAARQLPLKVALADGRKFKVRADLDASRFELTELEP
jgi:hypothetical protein